MCLIPTCSCVFDASGLVREESVPSACWRLLSGPGLACMSRLLHAVLTSRLLGVPGIRLCCSAVLPSANLSSSWWWRINDMRHASCCKPLLAGISCSLGW